MSYDVWLTADLGGPDPVHVFPSWNYTSNGADMWRAAGADLNDFEGRTAGECATILRAALATLVADPLRFRPMEPANGWGSYDGLVTALGELLVRFDQAPLATVHVGH
jgi:hypothetical protein